MARIVLLLILIIIITRLFWRLFDSFVEGMTGQARHPRVPERGVEMARDPVCGTFVLPDRAVTMVDGRTRLFFCSESCRDKYRARTA
jgi:YHS domain-containing protein